MNNKYLTQKEIAEIVGCKPSKVAQVVEEAGLSFSENGVEIDALLRYLFVGRLLKDVMQQGEIADAVGCTQGLVSQKCTEAGISRLNGGYETAKVLKELFKNRDTDELATAKLRKERAVARIMEMRRDEIDAKLISITEAEELCVKAYKPLADKIRLLPKRLAGRIVEIKTQTEALKFLTQVVDKTLKDQVQALNKLNIDVEK